MSINNNIKIIRTVFESLSEFKDNYHKKFNFSKLMRILSINREDSKEIIELVLKTQEIMDQVFKFHQLKIKLINGNIYIITDRKDDNFNEINTKIPEIIQIEKEQIPLINDLIYTFKFIEKGKGFNLDTTDTELQRKVKELYLKHSYLFRKNSHNLIYPNEVCIKLGDLIFSYNVGNKKLNEISIKNYHFRFNIDD